MSDIASKIRDMEEQQPGAETGQRDTFRAVMDQRLTVFDHYFAAALTGVIARSTIGQGFYTDQHLAKQAFDIANAALLLRRTK